jgi:hypothetical protein
LCANLPNGVALDKFVRECKKTPSKKPAGVGATTGTGRQQLEGKDLKTAAAPGAGFSPLARDGRDSCFG